MLGNRERAKGSAHAGGGGDASGPAAVLGRAAGVPGHAPLQADAQGQEEGPHRLRIDEQCGADHLGAHFATVPRGMANYMANREAALEAVQPQQKGNAAHAAGQPHGPRSGPLG